MRLNSSVKTMLKEQEIEEIKQAREDKRIRTRDH